MVRLAPRTLASLATEFGGEVDEAARDLVIEVVAPVGAAEPDALAPLTARRFGAAARAHQGPLLVARDLARLVPPGARWIHEHAWFALARLLAPLDVDPDEPAIVDPTASFDVGAVVMPGARIGPGAHIGHYAVIHGRVDVGARAFIGAGTIVGRPGFGWAAGPNGALIRVPQLGGVVIEDDVELGPICTVDAGTLTPTVIGRGAKLDAKVHVGHNTKIGPGTFVAAQAGFAGSVTIGAGVRVGGQAGVADHVTVGDGAVLAAKAGVIGDVPPGAVVAGYPAVERIRWLRGMARALRGDDKPRRRR